MIPFPFQAGQLGMGGSSDADALHWNPSDKDSNIALSPDLQTMWNSLNNAHKMVRGYVSRSSGKRYIEFYTLIARGGVGTAPEGLIAGFIVAGTSLGSGNYPGVANNTFGLQWRRFASGGNSIFRYLNGASANAGVDAFNGTPAYLGIAVDFSNNQVWWNVNGTWAGGLTPQGSPSTGSFAMNSGQTLYPAASCFYPVSSNTDARQRILTTMGELRIGAAAFGSGQALDGFTPWSD